MNAPTRQLSDEQWALLGDPAVPPRLKRLAGTIAFLGTILGVIAIAALLFTWNGSPALRVVSLKAPPPVIAASLSFFAIGFGAVSIYGVKQIPKQGRTRVISAIALLLGLAGPPIYAWQAFQFHTQLQAGEIDNCQALTRAAMDFLQREKRLPADILELAQSARLSPDTLKTSFGSMSKLTAIPTVTRGSPDYASALADMEKESDFIYLGGNIAVDIPAAYAPKIILLHSKSPHLQSESAAVGFADGSTRWVSLDEAQKLYDEDTAARAAIGAATRPTPVSVNATEQK